MPAITVRPGNPQNTHQLSLAGGGRKYGIKLKGGARSIVETPASPSNIQVGADGRKFGDWDPSFSHIEVRDWTGGRGSEFYSDDPTQFYDGYGWTLSPGVWHQSPQWMFGEDYVPAHNFMPGAKRYPAGHSVKWQSLASTQHYARSFPEDGLTAYSGTHGMMWVRRIGKPPAPLSLEIGSSGTTAGGAGRPSSAMTALAQLATSNCEELESFVWVSSFTTALTVSSGSSNKWLEVYTSVAGTEANHWEIGYNGTALSNSTVLRGTGSSSWSASTINFFFRLSGTNIRRKWHLFEAGRALYAADNRADGGENRVLINGDRGIASSGNPGSTAVLNDSTKSWETNRWSNSSGYALIYKGTGAGQVAKITGNGSTSLNTTWAIAPTSDSQYVIIGTDVWTRISSAIVSSATTGPVRDAVSDGAHVFLVGQDASTGIGKFQWNTSIHQAARDVSGADMLDVFHDPVDGLQLWRAVSSAGFCQRGSLTTDPLGANVSFLPSTGIPVGGNNVAFTNLEDYNDQMYVFKEDSIWTIKNDRAAKLNVGLDTFISSNNGRAMLAQNLFLSFSWSHSWERLHGGTLDDIGMWRGAGLKNNHQGPISTAIPFIAWTVAGVDASSGTGGVYFWNDRGWHEVYRAFSTGYPVTGLAYQSNPGTHPRVWMDVGGELISMEMPRDTLNPRYDKNLHFQHEAVIELGTIDMNARRLPKLFAGLEANTKNLASSVAQVAAEYQLDNDIGSTSWLSIGQFYRSPSDDLNVRRGDSHSIRFRARALTQVSTTPSIVEALTAKSVARSPIKRMWTLRGEMGDFQVDSQGMEDVDPDEFYLWLQDVAVLTEPLLMNAAWEALDNVYVYAESPTMYRKNTTPSGEFSAEFTMTLREI